MNLLLILENAEADIEREEYQAPEEADRGHHVGGGSVIDGFIDRTSDDRSQDLTGREEGAIET